MSYVRQAGEHHLTLHTLAGWTSDYLTQCLHIELCLVLFFVCICLLFSNILFESNFAVDNQHNVAPFVDFNQILRLIFPGNIPHTVIVFFFPLTFVSVSSQTLKKKQRTLARTSKVVLLLGRVLNNWLRLQCFERAHGWGWPVNASHRTGVRE